MSDYPFKKGDLVDVKTSQYHHKSHTVQGVIVGVGNHGFFEVLIDGEVKPIHRNYIVTPRVKSVKMTGGLR